jgi:multidrug efflux pump subunit AcrA (membrane-fusion protein)
MATRPRNRFAEFPSRIGASLRSIPVLLKDRRTRWRVIGPGIAVLALIGGAIYYYEGVYVPAQKSGQPTLQTTVARRGSIVLSAAGTGTLQAAQQVALGFKTNGKLTSLNVKVGDQVKEGQLLAELDNSSQKLQLAQARQTLAGQTNASAIASAQQSIATSTQTLQTAISRLAYLISPPVYYWEQQIAKDEQAVRTPRRRRMLPRRTRRRRPI